ncbi:hypothetical protein FOZ62_011603, partial [Perkinsus olseni]
RYSIRVDMAPGTSTALNSLMVEGFQLNPPAVVPGVWSYELTVSADVEEIEVFASAEGQWGGEVCILRCNNGSGVGTMGQTVRLDPGPPWFTQLPIITKSADRQRQQTYVLNVRREVSSVAELAGLSAEECELTPAFHPNVTDYSCTFRYNVTMTAKLTPLLDSSRCPGCIILAPDNTVPYNLRNEFSKMRPRQWASGRVWFR